MKTHYKILLASGIVCLTVRSSPDDCISVRSISAFANALRPEGTGIFSIFGLPVKKYLLILFIFCSVFSKAQNLIPNPSFENYISCPTQTGAVDSVVDWFSVTFTPDYFNSCTSVWQLSVPQNFLGFQNAHSGNAYCGMVCYYTIPNQREYIGTQTASPLVVSQKYFLSFHLSLCGSFGFTKGCNKFGCKLSTVPFIYNSLTPDNNAIFYSDSIVTDTTNWVFIKGSFIADSAYNYIAFGNFFDDIHTDTLGIAQFSADAYYYFDDACLSTDSLTCNPSVEAVTDLKNEARIILFPNPFQDKINISTKRNEDFELCLYDITTRKLLQKKFTNSTTLNTEQLAKGIYIYEVRNKNGVIKNGKVVKE